MVYEIVKYDLIGATFYTKKERPDLEKREDKFYISGTKEEAYKSTLWFYSTNPNITPYSSEEKLLPYFACVTEDLPYSASRFGLTPKTYKNCQLMTEKHGSYLQFWHEETKQVLRIAINSHYYQPEKTNH
jgi:hypothetical protein